MPLTTGAAKAVQIGCPADLSKTRRKSVPGRFSTLSKTISSWGSRLHKDVKAGVNLEFGVAPWMATHI